MDRKVFFLSIKATYNKSNNGNTLGKSLTLMPEFMEKKQQNWNTIALILNYN
jgi:hypothetical protein